MTMNEFKEAMETEEMQKAFTAFLAGKKAETEEAVAEALREFAAAKGVPVGVQELTDAETENAAGGGFDFITDPEWWAKTEKNYFGLIYSVRRAVSETVDIIGEGLGLKGEEVDNTMHIVHDDGTVTKQSW